MTARPRLLLGVDTGGTYTDAALLDADSHEVIATGKSITTRGDLAIGVANAIAAVSAAIDPATVALVSISTTLATNAVVEGHGSPVVAFLVGFDDAMVARSGVVDAFRDVVVETIGGGHDHYGAEMARLDLERAAATLDRHARSIEAVAITSAFAVRNPDHELRLRQLVLESTELPVTISTELSDALDAPRRALTTVLNARLISRVTELVEAVRKSLRDQGIAAPLTIAKGDGSLAVAERMARRPVETVLSGPAASMVGAGLLSGLDHFVVSDMGGTTTDVGAVVDGRPRLVDAGAMVGGWRTMVRAIDVRTTGLGGDSAVHTDGQRIIVGPARHVPLALLTHQHPELQEALEADIGDPPAREDAGRFVQLPDGSGGFDPRSEIERRILDRLGPVPRRLRDVAAGSVERRTLAAVAQRGGVLIGGFTPSDAAHVLRLQANWSERAARLGAELLAWYTAEDAEEFCRRVWAETVRRSGIAVLEVALAGELDDPAADAIVDAAAGGTGRLGRAAVSLRPIDPVVAVGGPAGVFYPEVGARLRADVVLPAEFAVANAVGAAAGRLVAAATMEVCADRPGVFRVMGGERVETFAEPRSAIDRAEHEAELLARKRLSELASGLPATGVVAVELQRERHDDPAAAGDDGLYVLRIRAEASAYPYPAR